MSTAHLIIKGKVQGVFFRASTQDKAMELGISGWVKNTQEGNVEIMATGTDESMEDFISWCYQGPSKAKVTEVLITYCNAGECQTGFIIKR